MRYVTALLFSLCVSNFAFGLNIGDRAPSFRLKDAAGHEVSLEQFAGKIVVLEWTNPGCPYVKKQYGAGFLQKVQRELSEKGVVWLVVNSTNREHADFIPAEKRDALVHEKGMNVAAYLTDEDGTVGKLYGAKTTPHMFIVDTTGKLVYQGALDDAPMGDPAIAQNFIVEAVNELQAGREVSIPETKSYGCSVKY